MRALIIREMSWWADHRDTLEHALREVADSPARETDWGGVAWWTATHEGHVDEPTRMAQDLSEDMMAIAHPEWWIDHMDELMDGIERGREWTRESGPNAGAFDIDSALDAAFDRPSREHDRCEEGPER